MSSAYERTVEYYDGDIENGSINAPDENYHWTLCNTILLPSVDGSHLAIMYIWERGNQYGN